MGIWWWYWLVVTGTMEFWMTFHSVGNFHSSQVTKSIIIQRGRYTTKQIGLDWMNEFQDWTTRLSSDTQWSTSRDLVSVYFRSLSLWAPNRLAEIWGFRFDRSVWWFSNIFYVLAIEMGWWCFPWLSRTFRSWKRGWLNHQSVRCFNQRSHRYNWNDIAATTIPSLHGWMIINHSD